MEEEPLKKIHATYLNSQGPKIMIIAIVITSIKNTDIKDRAKKSTALINKENCGHFIHILNKS